MTIICVTRPSRILDRLRDELRFLPTDEPGIYLCDERLPQWIIYPTELALVSKNYPLLPLATGEKLEQFIDLCVREGLMDYLQLVMDVGLATDPLVIWQKILEVKQMRPALPEKTWKAQQTLIRQLRHKFPEVSDSVVRQIESTDDLNQLSKWLDRILDADTLTAMGMVLETEQNQ